MPSLLGTAVWALACFTFLPSVAAGGGGGGKFKCVDGAYPWCVHTPDDMQQGGQKYPTILFLPGSGARGSLSNAASLAGYDGVGKILSSGNPSSSFALASTKFITVIPIAPSSARHFDPTKIRSVLSAAVSSYPQIDTDRVVITGYSMGSRGTWRNLVFNTDLFAAGAPSAGAPEKAGDGTLEQEAAPATWPLLGRLKDMPIRAFAGTSDETAGHVTSEEAQKVMQGEGDTQCTLTLEQGATHEDMSTKPWEDPSLFEWFLQQSRSGSTGGAGSNSTTPSGTATGTASAPTSSATGTGAGEGEGDGDDCDGDGEGTHGADGADGSEGEGDDCDDDGGEGVTASVSASAPTATGSGSGSGSGAGASSDDGGSSSGASSTSSAGGAAQTSKNGGSGSDKGGSGGNGGKKGATGSKHGSSSGGNGHRRSTNDTVTRMARHRRGPSQAHAFARAHHTRQAHQRRGHGGIVRPMVAAEEGIFGRDAGPEGVGGGRRMERRAKAGGSMAGAR